MPPLPANEYVSARLNWIGFWLFSATMTAITLIFFLGDILMTGRLISVGVLAIFDRLRSHVYGTPEQIAAYRPRVAVLIPAYNEEKVLSLIHIYFVEPEKRYVLYSGGKIQVYRYKIDEVDVYDPGKNRGDVESYLVLGFGGRGHDLLKSYEVKFLGSETANGVTAEKLELIPKSDRFRNIFARIWLWIDPARGISVQQQFFEPSGDYRLAKYSEIQTDAKIPEDVFKLKTTKRTKFVPQG